MEDTKITAQDLQADEAVFGLPSRSSKSLLSRFGSPERRGPIATNASAILLGAVAASALGALAIASLAIWRLTVQNAHVQKLTIDELDIGQITVRAEEAELDVIAAY